MGHLGVGTGAGAGLPAVEHLVVCVPVPGRVRVVHRLQHRRRDAEPSGPQRQRRLLRSGAALAQRALISTRHGRRCAFSETTEPRHARQRTDETGRAGGANRLGGEGLARNARCGAVQVHHFKGRDAIRACGACDLRTRRRRSPQRRAHRPASTARLLRDSAEGATSKTVLLRGRAGFRV